jgi:hypothetical protein
VVEPVAAARVPHDRARVPLVAFVAEKSLDRGLLAVAGVALLLVALGGAVLLGVARRQLLLAAVGLLAVFAPAAQAAAPPSWTLVGTGGSNGWFTSNVTIRWTVDTNGLVNSVGCPAAEQITAEGSATRQCRAEYSDGSSITSPVVTIKIDKTAPTGVGGSLARGPDSDGWYNHPVAASFGGQDAVSGIGGCTAPTYSGADSATAGLSGTCTDVAGNTSGAASVSFKYDATPPTVTPSPERAPDHKGWYRKPVTISFAGTDITSGIASCSAPARYAGPDLPKAAVVGSCRDRAGNAAEAGHTFPFDDNAPKLAKPTVSRGPGEITIAWTASSDFAATQIVRSPGLKGKASSVVYTGKASRFVDKSVQAGSRYRYQLVVEDLAGNKSGRTATAGPLAPLYLPAAGAALRAPPLLRWQAVAGAKFYNVQLFRNGVKVLSSWPQAAKLRLGRAWQYDGKRQQLVPGRYRWYVWGARGTRERPTYGRVLGSSTFRIRR